jgi:phage antirepressor YoqD-like protein
MQLIWLPYVVTGRKPEVAGAKKYFATKTREAEVAIAQPKVPQSFAEALSLAAQQQKEIEEQAYVLLTKENEIRQMQPKVDHFDSIAKAGKWYGHETVAKCLAVAGMGQRNLMKFLRKHEYLTQNNRPCQDWINKGFAKTQFSDRGHEYAVYSIYGIGEVAKKLEAAGYAVVVQQQDMIEYDFNLPPAPRLRVLSGGK